MAGSGIGSMAKKGLAKGLKVVNENKQLSKLKDQAINQGLNYAVNQAGLDDSTGALVKGLGKNVINSSLNNMAGSGIGKMGHKALKAGTKALKVGNKVANTLGYDDLDNMAIDFATKQTIGRIDPTLGDIAAKKLNRLADNQLEGGSVNPYLPNQLRGGSLRNRVVAHDDLSDVVHHDSAAFNPSVLNDPMFDRLKLLEGQMRIIKGGGFRVYT